jgi:hypothetical protein
MAFLLLITEEPGTRDQPPAVGRDRYDRMMRFSAALRDRGVLRASESLRLPEEDGARVRVRGGTRIVVDGPFAEAKEIVGGFFLLDCASRDEALAIAAECPAAAWATVEVRRVGPCYE